MLINIQENKKFDTTGCMQPHNNERMSGSQNITKKRYQHCSRSHKPKRCLTFGKKCVGCGKRNYAHKVCETAIEKCPKRSPKTCRDSTETLQDNDTSDQEFDMVRRNVFNVHLYPAIWTGCQHYVYSHLQ